MRFFLVTAPRGTGIVKFVYEKVCNQELAGHIGNLNLTGPELFHSLTYPLDEEDASCVPSENSKHCEIQVVGSFEFISKAFAKKLVLDLGICEQELAHMIRAKEV